MSGYDVVAGTFDLLADGIEALAEMINDPAGSLHELLGLGDGDRLALPEKITEPLRPDESGSVKSVKDAVDALIEVSRAVSDFARNLEAGGVGADLHALLARVLLSEALRSKDPALYSLAQLLNALAGLEAEDDVETLDVFRSLNLLGGRSNVKADRSNEFGLDSLMAVIGIGAAIAAGTDGDVGRRLVAMFGYEPDQQPANPSEALALNALTLWMSDDRPVIEVPEDADNPPPVLVDPAGRWLTFALVPPTTAHGRGTFWAWNVSTEVTTFAWKRATFTIIPRGNGALFVTAEAVRSAESMSVDAVMAWPNDGGALVDTALGDIGHLRIASVEASLGIGVTESLDVLYEVGVLIRGLRIDVELGLFDGLLSSLSKQLDSEFDLGFRFDQNGFHPKVRASRRLPKPSASEQRLLLRTPAAANAPAESRDFDAGSAPGTSAGPFRLIDQRVHVGTSPRGNDHHEIALELDASVTLGPVTFEIDGVGVALDLRGIAAPSIEPPNLVVADVSGGLRGPTGLGLFIDSEVVTGGGFLEVDRERGRYSGAISLRFGRIEVTGLVLIDTKPLDGVPWSALIALFADFEEVPLQLGFGFALTGFGGIVGLHRHSDVRELRDAAGTDRFGQILFPNDVSGNISTAISTFDEFFPRSRDDVVFGPAARIVWGTPPIVTFDIAFLIDLDGALAGRFSIADVVFVGALRASAPRPDADGPKLIDLGVDIVGSYDFGTGELTFVGQIREGSTIGGVQPTGTVVFRAVLGGGHPNVVLSAGGFHPDFHDLPPGLPAKLDRLGFHWSLADGAVELDLKAYVALTPASWQMGAAVSIDVSIGSAGLDGDLSFDVVVYDDGRFTANLSGGVHIRWRSHSLCGVDVDMVLERRRDRTWNARGSASFEIGWWDLTFDFDRSWGTPRELPTSAARSLVDEVRLALQHNSNWEIVAPRRAAEAVVTRPRRPDQSHLVAHPSAGIAVRQNVAPLSGAELDHLDDSPIQGPRSVKVAAAPGLRSIELFDSFALNRYLKLSEADRLSAPGFERRVSGVSFEQADFDIGAVESDEIVYEVVPATAGGRSREVPSIENLAALHRERSELRTMHARSPLRVQRGRLTVEPADLGVTAIVGSANG